jgi:hypothetical protein
MAAHLSEPLRRAVILRAGSQSEYCGKPKVSFSPHEVDQMIAHRGGD